MHGLIPGASLNRTEKFAFNFGGPESAALKYKGPPGWQYMTVHEASGLERANLRFPREMPGVDKSVADKWAAVDDCMEELVGDALADRFVEFALL